MVKIGVFDSGFGGLTVLKEIIDKIPQASTEYYADSGRNPYGVLPRETIQRFSREILDFLGEKGIDIAVIACNTATAASLPDVEPDYPFPIIGVVGAGAKGAAQATKNRRVGVVATEFTVKSGAYAEAIKKLDPGVQVVGQSAMPFVRLVESGITTGDQARTVVRDVLSAFRDTGIDALVLGCTHFPLLASLIGEVMGPGVTLVDPAEETAKETLSVLRTMFPHEKLGAAEEGAPEIEPVRRYYTSGDPEVFARLGSVFLGKSIESVEKVTLGG
ncbi:MAG: glutamate racemase [Bacillota bacterium]|jgi:glutamate racemase